MSIGWPRGAAAAAAHGVPQAVRQVQLNMSRGCGRWGAPRQVRYASSKARGLGCCDCSDVGMRSTGISLPAKPPSGHGSLYGWDAQGWRDGNLPRQLPVWAVARGSREAGLLVCRLMQRPPQKPGVL